MDLAADLGHSLGLLAGRTRAPLRRGPVPLRVRGLPHLDQMTVGIADVAADLVLVLLWWRQELSAPGTPFGVHGLDVFDPNIEETADPVELAWRLQGDRRLVVGRASPDIDDDPAVGERDIGSVPRRKPPCRRVLLCRSAGNALHHLKR